VSVLVVGGVAMLVGVSVLVRGVRRCVCSGGCVCAGGCVCTGEVCP